MYDFIGDVHGHADRLKSLLEKLSYIEKKGVYAHGQRKAVFVGDYIDRGPQIPETLGIIKAMVDEGHAVALMGNHEYNAICFHLESKQGGHLRRHSIKNILQHYETLRQFQNRQTEYDAYIEWFLTLPLFLETEHFRAVHACWNESNITVLKSKLKNNRLTKELVYESVIKGTQLYKAVDETLKGKEMKMPEGLSFKDKDGNLRTEIRTRWWLDPNKETYKTYSIIPLETLPDHPVEADDSNHYLHDERPVFFGHYWLMGEPSLFRNNVCCLDYSVAKKGLLAAYSWDDERDLQEIKFTAV